MMKVLGAIVMAKPESGADESSSRRLINGQTVMLCSDELVVTDAAGRESTRIRLKEITVVHRGGADVIVVRGYHDPVTLRFAGVAAAEAFERSLSAVQPRASTERPQRAWWPF